MEEKKIIETNTVKPSLSHFEKEREWRIISFESETKLDSKISEIENYINSNHGRNKSEDEKDELYKNAQIKWEEFAQVLRDTDFTFYLNRKQYHFLTDLLIEKMEYDVNTIFLAIELTDMLGEWKDVGPSKDDDSLQSYKTDATEITYIYHLISKHKVKGLTSHSYKFAEILRKIGAISKIIAYYDTAAKNLANDIKNWVASFEENVLVEGKEWGLSS